jgi:VanZ family protein
LPHGTDGYIVDAGQEMIRTAFNIRLEHALAYLIATIAVALAYPRHHAILLPLLTITYAAVLEAGQVFVAGRHSGLFDWIASSTGFMRMLHQSLARNRSS